MHTFELVKKSKELSDFEESNDEISYSKLSKEKISEIAQEVIDDLIIFEKELKGYIDNPPIPISEEELNTPFTSYT